MTALPPQSPDRPPRYRFRPRDDHYTMPTFRAPMTPRVPVQPCETYDPRNEARPFAWSELRDPQVWLGGGLLFAVMVIALIVVLSSGPQVAP